MIKTKLKYNRADNDYTVQVYINGKHQVDRDRTGLTQPEAEAWADALRANRYNDPAVRRKQIRLIRDLLTRNPAT